jgi:hypothetical protein
MNTALPDYTDNLTDAEIEHLMIELARIESESSADNDAIAYGSH